jgi:hypothetical protein
VSSDRRDRRGSAAGSERKQKRLRPEHCPHVVHVGNQAAQIRQRRDGLPRAIARIAETCKADQHHHPSGRLRDCREHFQAYRKICLNETLATRGDNVTIELNKSATITTTNGNGFKGLSYRKGQAGTGYRVMYRITVFIGNIGYEYVRLRARTRVGHPAGREYTEAGVLGRIRAKLVVIAPSVSVALSLIKGGW